MYPLLQRCLLVVWVARTEDGDLVCADWASEKRLTTYITLQQLTVLPATTLGVRAITCHRSHVNEALNVLSQETTELPFHKWTVLTVLFGKKKKNKNEIKTTAQILSLTLSPTAVPRAFTSTAQQGTDVGWLKNLSLPLFYWLVTTEKFALIYFKSKWVDLHKTGGKSQFLMRMLNKDSV